MGRSLLTGHVLAIAGSGLVEGNNRLNVRDAVEKGRMTGAPTKNIVDVGTSSKPGICTSECAMEKRDDGAVNVKS